MTEQHFKRRRIRLPTNVYADVGPICSVTIAVKDRCAVFADAAIAEAAVGVLRCHAARTGVPIFAFCVMPDHVHLILGASTTCDIITFVGQFKNLAQRAAWKMGIKGAFWQKSFWDHFLRADEDFERVVAYVLNNPVRSGMVGRWSDYRFSGSFVFALTDPSGGQAPALRPSGGQAPALRSIVASTTDGGQAPALR